MSIKKFREMSPLEEELLLFMQKKVKQLNPSLSIKTDPMRKAFLTKESYKLRDEFSEGNYALVMDRRVRLKKILLQEAEDQEKMMRELGYAYIPTQL